MQSGVILILLSMSLTPFGDALSKHLGETQSPLFIVFLRYFTAGLIALAIARATRTPVVLPRRDRAGMIVRTALVMAAMTLLIVALSKTSLANAVGGFLIAPIIATLISAVIYGEKLTLPRNLGAAISFLGAMLILRPGAGLDPGMMAALLGGVFLGAFLSLSRRAPPCGNALSALAIQCLLGSAMILPFALPQFVNFRFDLVPAIFGLGMVTAATHFLTVAAYQKAEASKLAPFFYFNLVAAVFVGLVWFSEIPDILSLLGLSGIVAGGLVSLASPEKTQKLLRRNINGLARLRAWHRRNYANT